MKPERFRKPVEPLGEGRDLVREPWEASPGGARAQEPARLTLQGQPLRKQLKQLKKIKNAKKLKKLKPERSRKPVFLVYWYGQLPGLPRL